MNRRLPLGGLWVSEFWFHEILYSLWCPTCQEQQEQREWWGEYMAAYYRAFNLNLEGSLPQREGEVVAGILVTWLEGLQSGLQGVGFMGLGYRV